MADLLLRRYSNNAPDMTLVGAISNTATSIVVSTITGLPSAPFTIEIENEVLLVTAVTGTTLTVQRGYDGSTAAGHADATLVQHVLTADDFDHRWQDTIVSYPFGSLDDEFDDGTKDAAWIETAASGTATWTESNGVLSCLLNGQASEDAACIVKPTGTLAIGQAIQTAARAFSLNNNIMFGPVFASGFTTTSNIIWQVPHITADTSDSFNLSLRAGTMESVATNHYTLSGTVGPVGGWVHMRLVWATVNTYRAYYSLDGVSWSDFDQGTFTNSSVSPPSYMGLGVSAWGGTGDKLVTFEHFRVVDL